MTELPKELPAVAKSFSTFCKKCDNEVYHTVLAHKTEHSAKLECEICKKKSTYSIKKKVTRKKAVRKSKALTDWESVSQSLNKNTSEKYSISGSFKEKMTLEHPKFGLGYIMKALPTKIEVIFEEGIKTLVQNR